MAKKSKGIMMIGILGFGLVALLMMCVSGALFFINFDGSQDDPVVSDTYSYSPAYGKEGRSEFGAVCNEGSVPRVEKVFVQAVKIGPHVKDKRHSRVAGLGVQCVNGTRHYGNTDQSSAGAEVRCQNDKKMIGAGFHVTGDAVQRLEPICEDYSQKIITGNIGKDIGDKFTYVCPSNMYLSGFSGSHNDQLKQIRVHCNAMPAPPAASTD